MKTKNFKELKKSFIKRCKDNNACEEEFKRVLLSKTKKQLLQIIKDNINWSYRQTNTVTIEVLDWFGNDSCNELGIYYKGKEQEISNKKDLIFLGDFECKMLDSSQVGEMLGSSQVGEMLGSSQVGKMLGSSQVGEMWDSSQVGEMWDSSQVGKMWGSSQVGKMFGSSTVRIGKGYYSGKYENIKSQKDNSQIIDLNKNKIYIRKNKFEIVEI